MSESTTWQQRLFARYYYQQPGWQNGTSKFFDRCRKYIGVGKPRLILELGCGPTNSCTQFLAGLGTVHGADIDPEAAGNQHIAQFRLIDGSQLDYPAATFDACVSFWTAEHVEHPQAHLEMVWRALKPGAHYLFMTPNKRHYTSLVSNLTPHKFHLLVANRLRALPPDAHDPYPTFYRLNTDQAIREVTQRSGFEVALIDHIEVEPVYGRSSKFLFYLFLGYERLVSRWELFSGLRHTLIVVLRKPLG